MTREQFKDLVSNLLRRDVQDNFINNISDTDVENAMIMALGCINLSKPITHFTIDDILSDENNVWLNPFIYGTAYHIIMHQVSEWMHNGINISIDELSVEDKMSAYKEIADHYKDECKEMTQTLKSQIYITKPKSVFRKVVPNNPYASTGSSRARALGCMPYTWRGR